MGSTARTRVQQRTAGLLAALLTAGLAGAAAAPAALPPAPPPQPAPLPGFVTDAPVNALARSAGRVFLGGDFTRIGPATGGGVVLDPAGGQRAAQFPDVRGIGFVVVPDGAGGYYLGGRFSAVGGVARRNLAHVLADGSIDAA